MANRFTAKIGAVPRRVAQRFGWGLADQAMSSLSNAAMSFYVARELGAPGAVTIGNAISADGKRILLTNGYSSLSDDDFSGLSVEAVPWSGVSSKLLAAHGAFASWSG